MPMINGMWVDDATGVPDPGMPMGMGDPTGASMPPPPPPQMARPPSGPPNFLAMQGPAIPPPVTDPQVAQQIQQGFQQLDRPQMGGGDIAGAILRAPLSIPMGIAEELRGLMGGSTIEGWAQQARDRYGDPNYNESRAFGVQGAAKEPDFGDRFLGVVTGSAQRGAMAGKILRQQIGEYNANRRAALRENKDVMQLQQGQLGIEGSFIQNERNARKNEIERKYSDLQAQLGIAGQQQGLANTGQEMQARNLQMILTKLRIGTAQEKADAMQQLTTIFNSADPETRAAARGLTGGAAALTQDQYLPPTAVQTLQDVQGKGIANQGGVLRNLGAATTMPDPVTGLRPDQALAEKARLENEALKRQLEEEKTQRLTEKTKNDLLNAARDDIRALYTQHIPAQAAVEKEGITGALTARLFGDKSLSSQREENLKLRDAVIAELERGNLTREEAMQIFPGGKTLQDFLGSNYDPAIGAVVRPSLTEPLAPSSGTGPDQRIGEPVGPTPSPTASRGTEAQRQDNATRVKVEEARFQDKWKREALPLGYPIGGPAYKAGLDKHLLKYGLKRETME